MHAHQSVYHISCRKMAARTQPGIRETIHTLLSILADNGVPRIPSESFRRAKFNQPEAIDPFWNVLFYVIQLAHSLESGCSHGPISCVTQHRKTEHPSKLITVYVRWHLFSLGYVRTAFFSDCVGSRESVLALAWLLHKTDLFTRLTLYHLSAANSVHIPLGPSRAFILNTTKKDFEAFKEEVDILSEKLSRCANPGTALEELQNVLQRLMWLKGKLLCRWRSVLSKHQGFQKMADKLHRHTAQSSSGKHLTVHEVFLMRYPDQLAGYLEKLEKHLIALQRLLEWQSCEHLFWRWMESVLDLDEKEKREVNDNPDLSLQETQSTAVKAQDLSLEQLGAKVQSLEKEMSVLLERNKLHIDKINRTWSLKSRSLVESEVQRELNHIDSNMGVKVRTNISRCLCSSKDVEQLNRIDLPVRLTEDPRKTSRQLQFVVSNFLQDQQKVNVDLIHALSCQLEQIRGELKMSMEKIERSKVNVAKQVEVIEQGFPHSVCKVET